MAVVVLLFIAVLKQFGILEPMSMEGNAWPRPRCPPPGRRSAGTQRARSRPQPGTPSSVAGPPPSFGALGPREQRGLGLLEGTKRRRLGWV